MNKRKYASQGLGALFALAVSACGAQVDISKVQAAVDDFRGKQTASDDQALYQMSSRLFQDAIRFDDFKRLQDAARAAIASGCDAPPTTATQWNVNYTTNGEMVTLAYARHCRTGEFDESFVYRVENSEPKLAGYHISGMALFPTSSTNTKAESTATPDKPGPSTATAAAPPPTSPSKP